MPDQLRGAQLCLVENGRMRTTLRKRLNPGSTIVYTSLTADGRAEDQRCKLMDLVGDVVIDRPRRSVTLSLNGERLVKLPRAYFEMRGVDSISLRDMIDADTGLWYNGQLHHFFGDNELQMTVPDGREREAAVHVAQSMLDSSGVQRSEFRQLRESIMNAGVDLLLHLPTTVRFMVEPGHTVCCDLPGEIADSMIEALELNAADAVRYIRRIRVLLNGALLHSFTPRARAVMGDGGDGPVWRIPLGGCNDRGEHVGGVEAGRIDQFRIEMDGVDDERPPNGTVWLTLVRPAVWGNRRGRMQPMLGPWSVDIGVGALIDRFETTPLPPEAVDVV